MQRSKNDRPRPRTSTPIARSFVFRTDIFERRLVFELVQEGQRALDAKLILHAPLHGQFRRLAVPGMTATAVRPVQGPQRLFGAAFLHQYLAVRVEQENRKSAMRDPGAHVAVHLRHRANIPVITIDQDKLFRRVRYDLLLLHAITQLSYSLCIYARRTVKIFDPKRIQLYLLDCPPDAHQWRPLNHDTASRTASSAGRQR